VPGDTPLAASLGEGIGSGVVLLLVVDVVVLVVVVVVVMIEGGEPGCTGGSWCGCA